MTNIETAFYTVDEVAKVLAISSISVRRLVKLNKIPYSKIGGSIRFDKKEIERFIKRSRVVSAL